MTEVAAITDFGLVVNHTGDCASVVIRGELDMYTSPRLRQALVSLVAQGARQVTIDLGGVAFVDSTALGVLVGGLKRFRQIEGDLKLRSPSARILGVLEMTGLTKVFDVRLREDAVEVEDVATDEFGAPGPSYHHEPSARGFPG